MSTRRLTKLTFVLIYSIIYATTAFAQQGTKRAPASRLIEIKVPAPSLKGNLLGDPTEQTVNVYLPPSYDSEPEKRFATVYLLHGFTGNQKTWTTRMNLQSLMDGMIRNGNVREMIVVMPSGFNSYRGGFYTNSAVNGNWEDYIFSDLVKNIDTNYRTVARAESRGIAGHSMGGYGAVTLAMKHPDVFSAVYALSPCCLGFEGDFTSQNPAWLKTLRLKSIDQLKAMPNSLEEFFQVAFVAVSAAFSPNPSRGPFFVDFPYEEREGQLKLNESVFAKWRAKMPLYMVDENKENLAKLRGIFIDYGENEDFSHIRITSQQFSKALAERNIPHVFEVYAGGDHGNKIPQRLETRVFQFFSEKLDFSSSSVSPP
jgi:S-formylglutathione hydrolase FrmB